MSTQKLMDLLSSLTCWIMPIIKGGCPDCATTPGVNQLLAAAVQATCKTCSGKGVVTQPAPQSFRATAIKEGCPNQGRFRMARGSMPQFDPATARYATSDMVANLAAHNGVMIRGDIAASRALLRGEHAWKQWMTLDDILAHAYLGESAPSKEIILAAYAEEIEA